MAAHTNKTLVSEAIASSTSDIGSIEAFGFDTTYTIPTHLRMFLSFGNCDSAFPPTAELNLSDIGTIEAFGFDTSYTIPTHLRMFLSFGNCDSAFPPTAELNLSDIGTIEAFGFDTSYTIPTHLRMFLSFGNCDSAFPPTAELNLSVLPRHTPEHTRNSESCIYPSILERYPRGNDNSYNIVSIKKASSWHGFRHYRKRELYRLTKQSLELRNGNLVKHSKHFSRHFLGILLRFAREIVQTL